jgi:hypothetical protein
MLEDLKPHDILLGDTHFGKARIYTRLKERNVDFITPIHQRLKISNLEKVTKYSKNDFIGYFLPNRVDQRKYNLPEKVKLRFVKVDICNSNGKKMRYLATSLFDQKIYPEKLIRNLYFK